MSLYNCRQYLRNAANTIGLKEWADGVNVDNIPSTLINKSYSLGQPSGDSRKLSQTDLECNFDSTIKIFFKGYRDTNTTIDNAVAVVDDLIKECLSTKKRVAHGFGIKNVFLQGFSLDTIGGSNDNIIVASVTFRILVILEL